MDTNVLNFYQKEHFLRIMVHITFILPCCWYRASSSWRWRKRARYMAMSVVFALFHWGAFGFEMYVAHTYWRSKMTIGNPRLPRETVGTLVLMVLLFLSGSITYTLAVAYFYNPKNKFLASSTRLIPRIEFKPDGEQEEVGPSKTDWFYTSIFLLIGTIDVAIMLTADHYNAFFDFCGIKDFTNNCFSNITKPELYTYKYFTVPLLFWALEGGVVMCCVFFVLTRDIVRHIEFTQRLIIEDYHDINTAKRRYLYLFYYTKKVAASLQLWFVVHSTLFFFIVLFDMIDLLIWPTKHRRHDCSWYWVAQVTGSFLIAFKFAFPFFAASRVSRRFDDMLKAFNEHFDVEHSFLTFCKIQKAGFTISGIRITFNLAMLSFLFSFVGILKEYIYSYEQDNGLKALGLKEAMMKLQNNFTNSTILEKACHVYKING